MTIPTADDLARWRALCEHATPGPWIVEQEDRLRGPEGWLLEEFMQDDEHVPHFGFVDDAMLCAAARTALPALIAEVERLRSEMGKPENCVLCNIRAGNVR